MPTLCWTQIIKRTDDSNKYHKCHKINKSWIWELWKVVKLEIVEFKEFANKKFSYHPQPVSGLWNMKILNDTKLIPNYPGHILDKVKTFRRA